jgi:hypothetical protein
MAGRAIPGFGGLILLVHRCRSFQLAGSQALLVTRVRSKWASASFNAIGPSDEIVAAPTAKRQRLSECASLWQDRRRNRARRGQCRGGETADAEDSKSSVRKHMRVQVPPSAPIFSRQILRRDTLAVKSSAQNSELTLAELWPTCRMLMPKEDDATPDARRRHALQMMSREKCALGNALFSSNHGILQRTDSPFRDGGPDRQPDRTHVHWSPEDNCSVSCQAPEVSATAGRPT